MCSTVRAAVQDVGLATDCHARPSSPLLASTRSASAATTTSSTQSRRHHDTTDPHREAPNRAPGDHATAPPAE